MSARNAKIGLWFASALVALVASASLGASVAQAQEPTSGEVVHVRAETVRGTRHRAAPILLPPPTNVYQRATHRDRARDPRPRTAARPASP